jgi:pyruvate dehydrogenase E1 component alpha subunit
MRIKRYRTEDEEERWMSRDPVQLFAAKLLADGDATPEELEATRARVSAEVEEAVEFGRSSPLPPLEDALADNYAPANDGRV